MLYIVYYLKKVKLHFKILLKQNKIPQNSAAAVQTEKS